MKAPLYIYNIYILYVYIYIYLFIYVFIAQETRRDGEDGKPELPLNIGSFLGLVDGGVV